MELREASEAVPASLKQRARGFDPRPAHLQLEYKSIIYKHCKFRGDTVGTGSKIGCMIGPCFDTNVITLEDVPLATPAKNVLSGSKDGIKGSAGTSPCAPRTLKQPHKLVQRAILPASWNQSRKNPLTSVRTSVKRLQNFLLNKWAVEPKKQPSNRRYCGF
jgi:hypothetical protein